MAALGLDNTWMQAQDRAKKAGRILGEVLEKRVQGERPVVLASPSKLDHRFNLTSVLDWIFTRCIHCPRGATVPRLPPNPFGI